MESTPTHPFERAGLGRAPFQYVGMEHRTYQACQGAPIQPGGSCDFCGTGISYFFWILSSDGHRFKVGSDCVFKTKSVDPELTVKIKAAQREQRAAERAARRIAAAEERERGWRESRAAKAAAFIASSEGLREAFETGASVSHAIVADLHAKLIRYGSLSEKQVSFALRLAEEIRTPRAPEVHVPAPTGRVEVAGTVVSLKEVEDHFGFYNRYTGEVPTILKMIVKVETGAGSWLCWATVPSQIHEVKKGDRVRFTATLSPGRDAHFAFAKRPTKATIE